MRGKDKLFFPARCSMAVLQSCTLFKPYFQIHPLRKNAFFSFHRYPFTKSSIFRNSSPFSTRFNYSPPDPMKRVTEAFGGDKARRRRRAGEGKQERMPVGGYPLGGLSNLPSCCNYHN